MDRVKSWIFRKGFYKSALVCYVLCIIQEVAEKRWSLPSSSHTQEPNWHIKVYGLGEGKGNGQRSFWFNLSEAVPILNIRFLWLIRRIKFHQIPWLSALCWVALVIKGAALLEFKSSPENSTQHMTQISFKVQTLWLELDYTGTAILYSEKVCTTVKQHQ